MKKGSCNGSASSGTVCPWRCNIFPWFSLLLFLHHFWLALSKHGVHIGQGLCGARQSCKHAVASHTKLSGNLETELFDPMAFFAFPIAPPLIRSRLVGPENKADFGTRNRP